MKPDKDPPINWNGLLQMFIVSLMMWALILRLVLFIASKAK
jgi:hypothetical protein